MKKVVMVEAERALYRVDKWHANFVKHHCPGCRPFLVRNVVAAAVIAEDGRKVRQQLGKDAAFVVLRLGQIVRRAKDEHVLLP